MYAFFYQILANCINRKYGICMLLIILLAFLNKWKYNTIYFYLILSLSCIWNNAIIVLLSITSLYSIKKLFLIHKNNSLFLKGICLIFISLIFFLINDVNSATIDLFLNGIFGLIFYWIRTLKIKAYCSK